MIEIILLALCIIFGVAVILWIAKLFGAAIKWAWVLTPLIIPIIITALIVATYYLLAINGSINI